jgi:hypothetical protein
LVARPSLCAWDKHLTRIRRNYVFKGVNFYIYHGCGTAEGFRGSRC